MPGLTPYRKIRYPLVGEVVDAAAVQNMAADMNTVLTASALAANRSTHRSSVRAVYTGSPTIVKNTLTVVTFGTPLWDNGALGPGGAAYWAAGSPTRFTAPATGLYCATGSAALD